MQNKNVRKPKLDIAISNNYTSQTFDPYTASNMQCSAILKTILYIKTI